MRHFSHWEFKVKPDVLILPSRLTLLAKDVMGTLVVNPGQLTKNTSGGTYAELAVHPMKKDQIIGKDSDGIMQHSVSARTSVVVKKI